MLSNKRSRTLHSAKYIEKKRKKNLFKTLFYVFCAIVVIGLIILFFRIGFMRISSVTVDTVATTTASEIEKTVLSKLEGNYLYFIPKSNTLFYPKDDIERAVTDSFKKIDTIDVSRSGLSGLSIKITEKKPTAIVCVGFHDQDDSDQNCYFSDSDAYVYEKSPQFSEGVYPKYYISTSTDQTLVGMAFIPTDLFKNLQTFIENAGKSSISPLGLFIAENGNYELYIKNMDNSEAVVYFDDRAPFDKTLSNFVAFWGDSFKKKKNATSTPIFEYINLRYGNNIFYETK